MTAGGGEGGNMEDTTVAQYWCHMCSQMVNPIVEVEIKCPFCLSGFIEEISSSSRDNHDLESDFGPDRAVSLWAPILLGMMGDSWHHRRNRRMGFDEDDDNNDDGDTRHGGETELESDLGSVFRRRRSSAMILQLLQGIRAGMVSELENSEEDRERDRDTNRDRERDRERVLLVNPFNRTIFVQGTYDSSSGQNQNHTPIESLGDHFIGPGLDLLLQHLAENDPNRYGTPPAKKEAIEALPTVTINETLLCSVCLDDIKTDTKVKAMPCKHKFHTGCILPWLELHSSCPVCRYQLPTDETKLESDSSRNTSNQRDGDNNIGETNNRQGNVVEDRDGEARNGNGRRFSIPWPLNGLFSSTSASQLGGSNSSSTSSPSLANAPRNASEGEGE